jgi:hypothetical protein
MVLSGASACRAPSRPEAEPTVSRWLYYMYLAVAGALVVTALITGAIDNPGRTATVGLVFGTGAWTADRMVRRIRNGTHTSSS